MRGGDDWRFLAAIVVSFVLVGCGSHPDETNNDCTLIVNVPEQPADSIEINAAEAGVLDDSADESNNSTDANISTTIDGGNSESSIEITLCSETSVLDLEGNSITAQLDTANSLIRAGQINRVRIER